MWFDMRREDLGFVERAPVTHIAEASLPAGRVAVFDALADAGGWPRWFPNVRAASYTTPPPHGVGTIREARVGGTRWVEEMIAWERGICWGWTVTGASVPFAAAQVETFALADAPGGTRVRWTIAMEPRLLAILARPFTAHTIPRLFARAMENLTTYLVRPEGERP